MSRLGIIAVVGIFVAVSSIAHGAPPPKHAAKIWKKAKRLNEQGKFVQAAEAFEAFFAIHPDRAALFNAAQCYERAKQPIDALRLYEKFVVFGNVSGKSQDPVILARKRVAALEAQLKATHARLTVTVTPAGAFVLIDGDQKPHESPLSRWVAAGSHRIQIKKPGYTSETREVSIVAGQAQALAVELFSATERGALEVRSIPLGAEVSLGGKVVGATPLAKTGVVPGHHKLAVKAAGHKTMTRTVTVRGNKTTSLNFTLVAVHSHVPQPVKAESDSVVKKWWFWTAIGAAVAGGTVTAILLSNSDTKQESAPAADWGVWSPSPK